MHFKIFKWFNKKATKDLFKKNQNGFIVQELDERAFGTVAAANLIYFP